MGKTAFFGVGIFVQVSDLERSTKWYKEMLGFEIAHQDEPNAKVMMMNDYKIMFCLVLSFDIERRSFPPYDPDGNKYGVVQLMRSGGGAEQCQRTRELISRKSS